MIRSSYIALVFFAFFLAWMGLKDSSENSGLLHNQTSLPQDKQLPRLPGTLAPTPALSAVDAVPETSPLAMAQEKDLRLKQWIKHYQLAAPEKQAQLMSEGQAVIREREDALYDLVAMQPSVVLELALNESQRRVVPLSLRKHLEQRVSARGDVALVMGSRHHRTGSRKPAARHEVQIAERTYDAYPTQQIEQTRYHVPVTGVAIRERLALSHKPARILVANDLPEKVQLQPQVIAEHTVDTPREDVYLEVAGDYVPVCCRADAQRYAGRYLQEASGGSGSTGGLGPLVPSSQTQGNKTVLVILTDFSDFPGRPTDIDTGDSMTTSFVTQRIGTQIANFFSDVSYGKTTLSAVTVTNVLRMPNTLRSYAQAGNHRLLKTHAETAAQNAGQNTANFDRVIIYFRDATQISNSEFYWAGLADVSGKFTWMNGVFDQLRVSHELGHNYGLRHANLWSSAMNDNIDPNGQEVEYGDEMDFMGDTYYAPSGNHAYPSPSASNRISWLPNDVVQNISSSGVYRLHRYDAKLADMTKKLALRIPRVDGQDYWIGFRRAYLNVNYFSSYGTGAQISWAGYGSLPTQTLDMTPSTRDITYGDFDPKDGALQVGQTFTDATEGISITVQAIGGSTELEKYMDVQVQFQSRLRFESKVVSCNEGAAAVVNVCRLGSSTGAVSVNYTTVAGTAVNADDYTNVNGTLNWASGDSGTKTILIPTVGDAVKEGAQHFFVRLNSPAGAVISNGSDGTVHLLEAGNRDPQWLHPFMTSSPLDLSLNVEGSATITGAFAGDEFDIRADGITRFTKYGNVDGSFERGTGLTGGIGRVVIRQPDGRYIVAGEFTAAHDVTRNRIARFMADGSLDLSFDPGTGPNAKIRAVAVQPDGCIWVGGEFSTWNGLARKSLVRLLPNGSLDSTVVNFASQVTQSNNVRSILLQPIATAPHYAVLVGGSFQRTVGNAYNSGIIRLNAADGTRDSSFSAPYGAHLSGATNTLYTVTALALQADGKILVGGSFTGFNGANASRLARLNANGSNDGGFISNTGAGLSGGSYNEVSDFAVQADGKILVAGYFTNASGGSHKGIVRYNTSGSRDSSFSANIGDSQADGLSCIALGADNFIIAGNNGAGEGVEVMNRFATGSALHAGSVQLAVGSSSVIEGTVASVTVTRSGGSSGAVAVNYQTMSDTATSTDFSSASGTLTWADGDSSSRSILIPTASDSLAEGNENFHVQLALPQGATLLGGTTSTSIQITDSGGTVPAVSFNAASSSVVETAGNHQVTLQLSLPSSSAVTVPFTVSGTASSSADYSLATSSVTFDPSETSKVLNFNLSDDTIVEGPETLIISLGIPTGGSAGLAGNIIHTVTLTDDDTNNAPAFISVPTTTIAALGSALTFNAPATGSPTPQYRWKRGSTVLSGQTSSVLNLSNVKSTAAGTYTVEAKNQEGSVQHSFDVILIKPPPQNAIINAGKTHSFSVSGYGNGALLNFEWLKNGMPFTAGNATGNTSKTLTLTQLGDADSAAYSCRVTSGAVIYVTGSYGLSVIDSAPVITATGALPDAIVGGSYGPHLVSMDGIASHRASSFKVTGLPKGMRINSTGEISGVPVVSIKTATLYPNIKITATNSYGASSWVTALTLHPQPATGRWIAMIPRNSEINENLGGYLDITATTNAYYTGKLVLGKRTITLKSSALTTSVGSNTATSYKLITSAPTGSLYISLSATSQTVSGTVTIGSTSAPISGFLAISSGAQSITPYVGSYNYRLILPDTHVDLTDIPQGHGYGSFKVDAKGKAVVTGVTPDAINYSQSISIGSQGQFLIYRLNTGKNGSLIGIPTIYTNTENISGALSWNRGQQTTATRFYPLGFSAFSLSVVGSKYRPVEGQNVLNVAEASNNVSLSFEKAEIEQSESYPSCNIRFQLRADNKVDLSGVFNPSATSCKINASTGLFSGTTTLKDGSAKRTVKYYGAVVTDTISGLRLGYGSFYLYGLEANDPILAGEVKLLP